jgi:hypothetical protein
VGESVRSPRQPALRYADWDLSKANPTSEYLERLSGTGSTGTEAPQVICLGRRVPVVVEHYGLVAPPRGAAPARLAAWSIGRAPRPGIRSRTDRGLEPASDALPVSYL